MATLDSQSSVSSEGGGAFTLDCLPLDCIICVCEYLSAEDLVRFSRVCTLFYDAVQTGYLWRRHCLQRWTFCDILQVPDGPLRWWRYFSARRRVESRLEQGRPGRDYRVKTLRGHEAAVKEAVVIGGGQVNWEHPTPPLVVSLDCAGNIKAWDVLQGKPMWSLEGKQILCLAANEGSCELATGAQDGTITFWDTQQWSTRASVKSNAGSVSILKYGCIKNSKLPSTFLMVSASEGLDSQIEIWERVQPDKQAQTATLPTPLLQLSPPSPPSSLHLSSTGLLAITTEGLFDPTVPVWDLPALTESTNTPPHTPHVTIHQHEGTRKCLWISPGCLATCNTRSHQIGIWDVAAHLETAKKTRSPLYDKSNMYNPVRSISQYPLFAHVVTVANNSLICGGQDGKLSILNPETGEVTQTFHDHKGTITDLYADRFRVLTCSADFSIRVYRWVRGGGAGNKPTLESRYTLLGGSVAHRTHEGFVRLLCEASSCVGIAGNQLKFYTFACKFDAL